MSNRRLAGLPLEAAKSVKDAVTALQQRQASAAEQYLLKALALAPKHPEALRLLGIAQRTQGHYAEAIVTLQNALDQNTDDPLILNSLGGALDADGQKEAALAVFRRAHAISPRLAATCYNLGKALTDNGLIDEAVPVLEQALALAPDVLEPHFTLAYALQTSGKIETAAQHYRAVVAKHPQDGDAWLGLANLKTMQFSSADVAIMEQCWQQSSNDSKRIALGFALAKGLEDLERYQDAFILFEQVNALVWKKNAWRAADFSARVEAILAAFSTKPATTSSLGDDVIFIVGLPRSGSTLVEQILASHPEVNAAGELGDLSAVIADESKRRGKLFPQWVAEASATDWQRLGHAYLQRTAQWRKNGRYFTDKMPGNWLYVGAALAMLPSARIIDCRRDAVETCWSCFRQLFAPGRQMFSYALDDIAAYWHAYKRAMQYWGQRYPQQIYTYIYEALLNNPEEQTRKLLDFCALPFNPACLQFYTNKRQVNTLSASQVREPLRRDTARVGHYGALLEPLRVKLIGLE